MRRMSAIVGLVLILAILSMVVLWTRQESAPAVSFTFLGYSNATARIAISNNTGYEVYVHPFVVIQTNSPAGWSKMAVEWWTGSVPQSNRVHMEAIAKRKHTVIAVKPPAVDRWRAGINLKAYPQSILSELRGGVRMELSTNVWTSEISR